MTHDQRLSPLRRFTRHISQPEKVFHDRTEIPNRLLAFSPMVREFGDRTSLAQRRRLSRGSTRPRHHHDRWRRCQLATLTWIRHSVSTINARGLPVCDLAQCFRFSRILRQFPAPTFQLRESSSRRPGLARILLTSAWTATKSRRRGSPSPATLARSRTKARTILSKRSIIHYRSVSNQVSGHRVTRGAVFIESWSQYVVL